MLKLILSYSLLIAFAATAQAAPLFEAKDGLLIIESESTRSKLGEWQEKSALEGFAGEGYLEFTGNRPENGPPKSPLKYRFQVDKDGKYKLWIRAHQRLVADNGEKARWDHCNDCYVRLDGNYKSGNDVPVEQLETDTKLYVNGKDTWNSTKQLDFHHPETHKAVKRQPVYELKAGRKYTLYISGRSQRFNMDRIILHHESIPQSKTTNPELPESNRR
ncbi:MAG: hypothetical protein AAFX93_16170 [Verrucomicrobiota bacterium]